ncbi:hypothetical protein [Nocardia thraciensis]
MRFTLTPRQDRDLRIVLGVCLAGTAVSTCVVALSYLGAFGVVLRGVMAVAAFTLLLLWLDRTVRARRTHTYRFVTPTHTPEEETGP